MDREQKQAAVAELTEDLKGADAVFAVDYRGISVTQAAELRRRLSDADAVFKVVKNRLAKRAVADAGTEGVDELLVGPTALTLIKGDAVIAAKAISTFSREHNVLAYKGGLMDGAALDADGFTAIARLPGLDVLHGQLVGLTASPLTGLAQGLNAMVSGLAIALGQIAEQGLVTGEAPAEEAEEAPAQAEEPAEEEEPAQEEEPAEEEPAEEEPAAEEAEPATEETPADEEPPDDVAEGAPAAQAEAPDEAPPHEHAEQEAQPEEPEQAPAQEAPAEPEGDAEAAETSDDDDEPKQEEPSGDESDD